jgi:hypothetical protein
MLFLVDDAGRPVGMKEADGDETFFPTFSSSMGALYRPDGSTISFAGFDVTSYGAKADGTTDDAAAVNAALAAIYENKGGTLIFPYSPNGYKLGSSIVIDAGQYAGGAGITVELGGNVFTPTHAGWCFDIKTNYFGANNGAILGKKPVYVEGRGATITTSNTAASGGFRWQDTVSTRLRDVSINHYHAGSAVQLYITTNDLSTWVEHGLWENITGSYNLNGIYTKSSNSTGSFLGNRFKGCVFETKVNNGKCYNFEGLHFDCVYENLGGYYNQLGTTGGCGFYLNGGYCGSTFIQPWIDVGNTGTQSALTDIVFGPNYTTTTSYYPTLINTLEINLPAAWRDKLFVPGPIGRGTLDTYAAANPREVLRDARTYYVKASGGSDSNDGLTLANAFATVQKALDTIYQTLDCASKTVTIQLADGAYTTPIVVQGQPLGLGSASLILSGNTGTPGNVTLTTASNHAIKALLGAQVTVQGIKVATTTSGSGLRAESRSTINIGAGMQFGACATGHIDITGASQANINANYTVNGASPIHWAVSLGSTLLSFGNTITCTGIAFSNVFAACSEDSAIGVSGTFSASGATGTRFSVTTGGVIQTYGAGASYLPGDAAGWQDTSTFGVYS